jgi:capsular exopolysaccharide synthesis family protein
MSNTAGQETIDLRAILRKLLSVWWLFLITVTLCVAAGVAYIKITPKKYTVAGVMLMSEQKRNSFGSTNEEFIKGTSYLRQSGELEDQISILMSYANVQRTIERLSFEVSYLEERNFLMTENYAYRPFIVKPDSSLQVTGLKVQIIPDTVARTYRVKAKGSNVPLYDVRTRKTSEGFAAKVDIDRVVKMGEPFNSEFLNFRIEFLKDRVYDKDTKYYILINSLSGLTTAYQSKSVATPQSDESNIVVIATEGEVVQKEVDFVNMLMRTYIESEQDKHNDKGVRTIDFIKGQLGQQEKKLNEAQSSLQTAQAGGNVGDAGDRGAALSQELFRLQDEQGRVRGKVVFLQELVTIMSNADASNPSTVSASNIDAPALNTLIDQYNKDVNELSQRRLTERIASQATNVLNRKVQTERQQIVQSAQGLLRQTNIDLDQINGRVGQMQYQLNQLPGADARRQIAQNQYELTEETNNYLMEKLYEAEIAVNSDQVDKYVVDVARQGGLGPVSPDKKVVLGGALLLGLLIPVLFVLVRDLFNDRIADVDEVKRLTGLPVLAVIPGSKRKRITADEPKSLLAESFRTARINLQYLNPDAARQVVGFTSSTSGEGKTFCAVNTATVMAMSGKRTLLIDADMRRPRMAETMDLADGAGLSNYLIGECPLEQVIRRTDIPGLDVITAGPVPPNPLELVESPRMEELFRVLRGRYEHIVVDASPMGLVSEFKVLVQHVDITLYVVRQGYTRRGMLRSLGELVREGKLKRVDMVLNDVKAGEGYGYYTA